MQTLAEIRRLLEERGLSPRKGLGQNFLIDHNLIAKLVDASGVGAGDTVLEVGPGTGTLTEALLGRGCRVVACEIDEGLADLLADRFAGDDAFALVRGDCLARKHAVSPELIERIGASGAAFRLVANLPYGAATPLMTTLLIDHPSCASMHVTIQREVADRLTAAPATRAYSGLSVLAQTLARVERIATLSRECFWPRPEVTSAMVSLVRHPVPAVADARGLASFCQRAFAQRRKQLGAVLGRDLASRAGVDPSVRVESLEPDQIVRLWEIDSARAPG